MMPHCGHIAQALKKTSSRALGYCAREMPTTALHAASEHGCLEIVQLLLKKGANPCVRDQNGRTASQLARAAGHSETADFLVRAEAAVARQAFRLTTPRITVDAEAVKRQLWTRSISLAAATAEFVMSFNMALDDHGEAARAAAAHRRDRYQVVPDRPVRFTVDCGDCEE